MLMLTPALVAGAIADEKRRKTLHYLLASRLTGPEIVLGKLLVRMLYVGVLLGVSFPVMSLLVLLGGIDPMLVLFCGAGLLSTAWFLAALSIWVSTIARRPREALFVTFGLEALWLIVPSVVRYKMATGVGWARRRLAAGGGLGGRQQPGVRRLGHVPRPDDGRVHRLGGGVLLDDRAAIGRRRGAGAFLAAVQLRPIFKRQDGAVARPRGLRALLAGRRLKWHRPLRDRPMIWKELHTGGAKGFARFVGWVLTLVLGGLLVYYGVWMGLEAFLEMQVHGYVKPQAWRMLTGNSNYDKRWEFRQFLGVVVPLIYLVGILNLSGAAAASITSEHEDDTWVSLTATDLTGREIVLSKLLGSLWRARRLAAVIGLLLLAGVFVGSLHPLSLAAMPVALAVYGWIRRGPGSLDLDPAPLDLAGAVPDDLPAPAGEPHRTGRRQYARRRGFAPLVWPGFTPYEVSKLVIDPFVLEQLSTAKWPRFWRLWDIDDGPTWLATFSIMSVVLYASMAWVLTFDALAALREGGRPGAARCRSTRIGGGW